MSVDLSISLTNNVFPSVFQDAILQSDPPMSRASHKNTDYSDIETVPMRSDSHRGLIWRLLADRGFGMQNRLLERYAAVTPQIHEIIDKPGNQTIHDTSVVKIHCDTTQEIFAAEYEDT